MFRLSLLLLGFAGLLLAQSSQPELKIQYFYQNQFLSNGASVVLEFKLTGCTGPGPFGEATIEFGDGTQTIQRVTCEPFRVPHTYYSKATAAKLTVGSDSRTASLLLTVIAPPPALIQPQPPPPAGQPPPAGGGLPGPNQDTAATYQLILTDSAQGLAGYGATVSVAEGKITEVKSVFFEWFNKVSCGAPCAFRGLLTSANPNETKRPLTNQALAEITVSGQSEPKIDEIYGHDCPAPAKSCFGARPIPATKFKLEKK